jgi:hypothetical protein
MDNIRANPSPPIPNRYDSKLTSVNQVLEAIEEYFMTCDTISCSYTIPGLCYFLGLGDTKLLSGLDEGRQGYIKSSESKDTVRLFSSPAVQQALRLAKVRIEAQRASQLLDTDGNVQALIFDLKATFGWQDKQAISVENPDGNLGSKYAVVLPAVPGQLSMAEWQKAYDEMMATRKQQAISDY